MRSEAFKSSLFEAIDFFIRIAEVNQNIELNDQNRLVLTDFITMVTSLRDNAVEEYICAETNGDIISINYLQKFLQKLTTLVNIAKSTKDNQELVPAIQELINLAMPSENHITRSATSISVPGIIGGIVGFTLGFIIGAPLGLLAGVFFYSTAIVELGSVLPILMIGFWAGCALIGGLTLGIIGAEKFYAACNRNTIESFTYNPLSKFEKQRVKTFNKDIFCRLFRGKAESKNEDKDQHIETLTKQSVVTN